MGIKNLNHGSLRIVGAGSGESLTIPIEVGDLRWVELTENHVVNARQALSEIAEGRVQAMEVSFTMAWTNYFGDDSTSEVTPPDALTQSGGASGWTTQATNGRYATELQFYVLDPVTATKDEKFVFPKFHLSRLEPGEDEDFNKIAVTGICLAARPTVTREVL